MFNTIPVELTDFEVLERVRAGETQLYAILAQKNGRSVRSFLGRFVSNRDEAEDILQEGHLLALSHLHQFEGRSSFSTWLSRIVVHHMLSRSRKQRRFQPLDAMPGSEHRMSKLLVSGLRSPEQQVFDAEVRVRLGQALAALPETYRRVFVLRAVQELSTTDTASSLGISEQCVKTRLFRAKSMLRRLCRPLGPRHPTPRSPASPRSQNRAAAPVSASAS